MEDKLIERVDEKIENILNEDINTGNLEHLYKLTKIKHLTKEDKEMYNGYGRGPGHGSYGEHYGEYNEYRDSSYGRRGYDTKYRGYGHLDRMYEDYGRYEESRERYGANEDTKRSLQYMLKSMEDFARMLREEAQSQEEVQMIKQTAQRIAQM